MATSRVGWWVPVAYIYFYVGGGGGVVVGGGGGEAGGWRILPFPQRRGRVCAAASLHPPPDVGGRAKPIRPTAPQDARGGKEATTSQAAARGAAAVTAGGGGVVDVLVAAAAAAAATADRARLFCMHMYTWRRNKKASGAPRPRPLCTIQYKLLGRVGAPVRIRAVGPPGPTRRGRAGRGGEHAGPPPPPLPRLVFPRQDGHGGPQHPTRRRGGCDQENHGRGSLSGVGIEQRRV